MILCRHNSGTDIDESMIWAYDGPMGLWAYDNLMSRDVSVCLEAQEMPRASCPPLHGEERLGHLGQLSLSLGSRTVPRFVVSFHVPSMFSRKLQETESQEHQMEHRKSKHAATNIMV